MDINERREAAKRDVIRRARKIKDLFSSPVGMEILQHLEKEFYHGPMIPNEKMTLERLAGQRDVVLYVRDMVRHGEMHLEEGDVSA